MRCDEAQELITARVDNEIDRDVRITLDDHLKTCPDCSRSFAQESLLKRRIQLTARNITAPAGLRRAIEQENAAPPGAKGTSNWRRLFSEATLPTWRFAFAATIILAIAGAMFFAQWRADKDDNIASAALETHASIISGKTALLRAVNLPAMRKELAHAVGDRFKPVVLDLSLVKLYPVAGFVQHIAGRDLLVTVYQGDGPAITCFTFLGTESDAPQSADRFYDADMGVNFYSF